MNTSFQEGLLPSDWKHSVVTPIYKKGDKLCPGNYRPIILTCISCKIMEKIIVKQIRNFLSDKNIIIDEQHGFVPKRSVVTNLLVCVDEWTKAWDDGNPMDVVYLDYEKAFDRVPIKRLLGKLEHFGVREKLYLWLQDFLSNRTFKVRVG